MNNRSSNPSTGQPKRIEEGWVDVNLIAAKCTYHALNAFLYLNAISFFAVLSVPLLSPFVIVLPGLASSTPYSFLSLIQSMPYARWIMVFNAVERGIVGASLGGFLDGNTSQGSPWKSMLQISNFASALSAIYVFIYACVVQSMVKSSVIETITPTSPLFPYSVSVLFISIMSGLIQFMILHTLCIYGIKEAQNEVTLGLPTPNRTLGGTRQRQHVMPRLLPLSNASTSSPMSAISSKF